MKLRNVCILFLAACLLLSCGCGVRIVEKPSPTVPAMVVEDTPVPTVQPTAEPTAEPTPEPTPEPTAEPTPEPTPEPAAHEGYRRGLYSFDDLVYERPDFDGIFAFLEDIRAMVAGGESTAEEIREAYDALDEAGYGVHNAYALASLYSSMDVNDEFYSSEVEYLTEKNSELAVLSTRMEIEIYESDYCDQVFYDWTEEDFENLRIAEKLYDDEYVALNTRLEELKNAYWKAQTETTVSFAGREYTMEELDELEDNPRYYDVLNDYYRNLNEVVGELYLEYVDTEKKIAKKAGFDNYADFSYTYEYERDYTPQDALALSDAVKKYVLEEFEALYASFTAAEYNGLMNALTEADQLTKRREHIEAYVDEISPDMREAYDYLVEYQLSALTDSASSQSGAYTTFLPTFDVPFIYIHEDGGYMDVTTFIHEFGHFYCNYLGGRDAAYSNPLDVDEICSQANEMLFLPYFHRYYKLDTYNAVVKYHMINALNSLINGCMFDEFQQYVYSHDVQSVEELNEIYREISRSYGIGDDYYYVDLGYVWIDVHHNFEAPMYYISYATSIVPALQIMEIANDDREEAIRVYNAVVRGDYEASFSEALEAVGLASPFEEQTIVDVVNAVVDRTGVGRHVSVG